MPRCELCRSQRNIALPEKLTWDSQLDITGGDFEQAPLVSMSSGTTQLWSGSEYCSLTPWSRNGAAGCLCKALRAACAVEMSTGGLMIRVQCKIWYFALNKSRGHAEWESYKTLLNNCVLTKWALGSLVSKEVVIDHERQILIASEPLQHILVPNVFLWRGNAMKEVFGLRGHCG